MQYQCQYLTEYEQINISVLVLKFDYLFDGTIGMWNTDSLDFDLNYYATEVNLQ